MSVAQRCNFSVGEVIDGRFQVYKELGEGSFGRVYAVKDPKGELLALKLLKLWEVPSDIRESLIARFDMEFETGRIESDYLVHSISHGMTEGNPYIVMEYCPNGDLLNLSEHEQVNLSKAAIHILCGLKALHNRGKVHRDLKPENVLVKKNGDFALTDFGISGDRNKRMTERNILGKPKQIFGTYAYMPPEQLNPKKDVTVLPTTDMFSFGVMMYQLLTGELPFGRLDSERDLMPYLRKGKSGDWNRQNLSSSLAGREWLPLIEHCLVPDFRHRVQNAEAALTLVPHSRQEQQTVKKERNDFQTRIVNGVLLRVMQGEDYGRVYKLDDMVTYDKSILRVGRKDEGIYNEIEIVEENSCYISRKHCTLELDYDLGSWVIRDGQWRINCLIGLRCRDLYPCKLCTAWCDPRERKNANSWHESTNGTYVNSTEVSVDGMPFGPGDIISIGDTKLRVEAY